MNESTFRAPDNILTRFTYFIKAIWIFFPGIIFLLLTYFMFVKLSQGQDVIYQSIDVKRSWQTGIYLVLASIFWIGTTWYTARLIGYDRTDLYQKVTITVTHLPRLLGYSIYLVLWIAVFLLDDYSGKRALIVPIVVFGNYLVYVLVYMFLEVPLLENKRTAEPLRPTSQEPGKKTITQNYRKTLVRIRYLVWTLIILSCVAISYYWNKERVTVLLYTLPILQLGFYFLVAVRYPLYESNPNRVPLYVNEFCEKAKNKGLWNRYMCFVFRSAFKGFDVNFERPLFTAYHIMAVLALFFYILAIVNLRFARTLTSFPMVLLSFGIILGIINFLAILSRRTNVNLSFLLIAVIVFAGLKFETHKVRTVSVSGADTAIYKTRMNFDAYLNQWMYLHREELSDTSPKKIPAFFILADGGASRSGYWVATVLAKLHEASRYDANSNRSYFMDHVFCLSGASGGSVGTTSFLSAYAIQAEHPEIKTDSLCRSYLSNDFLAFPLARLLGPDVIKPIFSFVKVWEDRAYALEFGMEHPFDKDSLMGKMMQSRFSSMMPNEKNRYPILAINTTRVNDGGQATVANILIDSVFGRRIDVAKLIPVDEDIRLSTAMVLGARFPYMSPGGKLGNSSYFVDGGYVDNSGAGIVQELLLAINKKKTHTEDADLKRALDKMQLYVIHISNTPYSDPEKSPSSQTIPPLINDLATPLYTLAGTYNSQTNFNDARLNDYVKETNGNNGFIILNLYIPTNTRQNISMNWVISKKARDIMDRRLIERISTDSIAKRLQDRRTDNLFDGLYLTKYLTSNIGQ